MENPFMENKLLSVFSVIFPYTLAQLCGNLIESSYKYIAYFT